ncbi:hypothetical protein QFC24_004515 [Naganishia onofrii]|uniref:Uncharacterized protein n=1 Tax=Naganishia onofrii TaxID=1851511 RepID=A0ACC2XDM9_9TREE|nr:hypothetical protein QFC24_004515 [Naganishia onofrii]
MEGISRAIQIGFWNSFLLELDTFVSNGEFGKAAVVIDEGGMVAHLLPMYYKVWMISVIGKIYCQVGQWEKAGVQFDIAKDIWDGPEGKRSKNFRGNESARAKMDGRLRSLEALSDAGKRGVFRALGPPLDSEAWQYVVSRLNAEAERDEGMESVENDLPDEDSDTELERDSDQGEGWTYIVDDLEPEQGNVAVEQGKYLPAGDTMKR